jgi:gluconokinase
MNRIVVMGVSGCGKTTVGLGLAMALGGRFVDADDLHTDAARAQMRAGTPLTDEDRAPWLVRVGQTLAAPPLPAVVACSALKRRYRDAVRAAAGGDVLFLHLAGPKEVIAARMVLRRDHYMPVSLLDSQFAALEPPEPDETFATLDLRRAEADLIAAAVAAAATCRDPG